ncbi:MAG: hypothetical protein VW034_04880 [Flavobacteriaceae bacterium]
MKNWIYLALIAFSIQAVSAQKYYLQCGNVFDPTSEKWQKEKTVVVEGKRITEVLNGFVDATGDDQSIDLKESWVMPGFIDMHVHIESESNPRAYLNRFTLNEADVAFRDAV